MGRSIYLSNTSDPITRCMLVRLAMVEKNEDLLQALACDPDPAVRWLVFRSMDEMDGVRRMKPRPHHEAIAQALEWRKDFWAGRAKAPRWLESLGPLTPAPARKAKH